MIYKAYKKTQTCQRKHAHIQEKNWLTKTRTRSRKPPPKKELIQGNKKSCFN